MVMDLMYMDLFNKKPCRDELILWLNIKLKQRNERTTSKMCDYKCIYNLWDLLVSCVCYEEPADGYIIEGVYYYYEKQPRERKCFEMGEL